MTELRAAGAKNRDGLTNKVCRPALEATRSERLPRFTKEKIIHQYLSGRKTYIMLAKEYNLKPDTVRTMVRRYKKKNDAIFAEIVNRPEMNKKIAKDEQQAILIQENEQLRKQLRLMQLKIEGYEIMNGILEDEYGIDLSKKSEAKQYPVCENDTQK